MTPLVARMAHTVSRSWSCGVTGIWRNVGGWLPSSVLQNRSYSDERFDDRVAPTPESSSSVADALLDTLLLGKFPRTLQLTEKFGAGRHVYDRNANRGRNWKGFRVCRAPHGVLKATVLGGVGQLPTAILKPPLTRTVLNNEESFIGNFLRAYSNVAQESRDDSPMQGLVCGKESSIGSARVGGNIHMPLVSITRDAIAILKRRQQQGMNLNSYALVEILKRCLKQKDLAGARQVHDCMIQSGMDKDPYVATTLLNVYVKCGRLQDARRVFDGLEKKTLFTWTSMIAGYAKNDHAEDALEVFNRMRQVGEQPNELTCLSILKACASSVALQWGKEVHAYIIHAGLESDVRVATALIQMYGKCGCITEARRVYEKLANPDAITWNVMIGAYAATGCVDDARLLFDRMEKRDVITWNVMIGAYAANGRIDDALLLFDGMEKRDVITWNMMIRAYADSGCGLEAYQLFLQMKREGFEPDAVTYVNILTAGASTGALELVKELHSHALRAGLLSDLRVSNALIHVYAKSGSVDDARLVFEKMEKRDVITWNTMIGGLAQHGCGHEALELFKKMNTDCVKPDGTSFVAVLSACCHAGLLDDGRKLFSAMTKDYGIKPTVVHYTCMADLLGRAGHLQDAKLLIGNMPVEPVAVTWGVLLSSCRTYGNVELGEFAAKELLKLDPKETSAYVLLSNIYAAAGKWEKVSLVRSMMQERGVRKEKGRSWIEVDSKIHEFVVGDTYHPDVKEVYSELKKLTDKLKAEGYIPDTKLVLPDINEEDKELALCSHSEKLAIAYGLLRIPLGKPIRVFKNLRCCSDCHTAARFISKVTGREIIARDAIRFHHFRDGMCSCGDYW